MRPVDEDTRGSDATAPSGRISRRGNPSSHQRSCHLNPCISQGGRVNTLIQAIRDQERRNRAIRAEFADLDRPKVVPLNVEQLRGILEENAAEWPELLRKHAPIARQNRAH